MRKTSLFLILVFFGVSSKLLAQIHSTVKSSERYYVLRVDSVQIDDIEACLKIYKQLEEMGYMVYYDKFRRDRWTWMWKISVGIFKAMTQAQEFKQRLERTTGKKASIDSTKFFVDRHQDDFMVVTTPSTIWLKKQNIYTELFRIELAKSARHFHPDYNQAILSPDGSQIVFYYESQIIKVDINTRKTTVMVKQGQIPYLLNSSPRWSPSGKYIAFRDVVDFEALSNLWIVNEDGTNLRRLVEPSEQSHAVKSFLWHPTKDVIYFVEGFGHGTVHVGGDLLLTDLEGNRKVLVEKNLEKQQEVFRDFYINNDSLFYKIAHFRDNYMYVDFTQHSININ